MPLTPKGNKIEHAMEREYGEKKGKQVFYASKNKGTITGVDARKKALEHKKERPSRGAKGGIYGGMKLEEAMKHEYRRQSKNQPEKVSRKMHQDYRNKAHTI